VLGDQVPLAPARGGGAGGAKVPHEEQKPHTGSEDGSRQSSVERPRERTAVIPDVG
jgi:hypothetical protein